MSFFYLFLGAVAPGLWPSLCVLFLPPVRHRVVRSYGAAFKGPPHTASTAAPGALL